MTQERNFDDRLNDWLEDGPTDAPDQLLDTVLVALPSIPQRRRGWRVPWLSSPMSPMARGLAGLVIVAGLGAASLFVVSRQNLGGVGGQGSPSPVIAASATPGTAPSGSPAATEAAATQTPAPPVAATATPAPPVAATATPAPPAIGPCDTTGIEARITMWEGAAGHRIAHVTLKNANTEACTVQAVERPQLVDGSGSVLIDGTAPSSPDPILTVEPGASLTTLVDADNYCGPAPKAPVMIVFVLADQRQITAEALTPRDDTVPPCLGNPGSAGTIQMHPWAP
jgi:hypothetical protein